jgi:hypothetical protein
LKSRGDWRKWEKNASDQADIAYFSIRSHSGLWER